MFMTLFCRYFPIFILQFQSVELSLFSSTLTTSAPSFQSDSQHLGKCMENETVYSKRECPNNSAMELLWRQTWGYGGQCAFLRYMLLNAYISIPRRKGVFWHLIITRAFLMIRNVLQKQCSGRAPLPWMCNWNASLNCVNMAERRSEKVIRSPVFPV